MPREDLLPIYLTGLEQARYELTRAEKALNNCSDPLELIRWSAETEVRRVLVRVYDGLITFVQRPE
jgi:hypothetical protein